MKTIILSILSILGILFVKKIELFSINIGLSWTTSKIIPYLLLVIFGFFIVFELKKINIKSNLLKFIVCFLVLVFPFGIGFILNPIFEGDFSKEGQSEILNVSPLDFKKDGLMVVTIPECPYCLESIQKLKLIKKRNPDLNIDYVVCTKNKKYIQNYIDEIGGVFTVRISESPDSLAKTVGFRFPTFISVKNKKPDYLWSNDQFGVRAIDEMENKY